MKLTSLDLANVRAIQTADLRFGPGFNLIVGVNGVGKSTVLDALCICMSRILRATRVSRSKARSFTPADIRVGLPFLDARVSLTVGANEFGYTRREWRETFAADDVENLKKLRREILDSERLRDRARNLLRDLEQSHGVSDSDVFAPARAELQSAVSSASVAPNCIFFSTRRSAISHARTGKSRAVGGRSAAYAEALVPRPMYLSQLADWMRAQEALAKERSVARRHLRVLRSAVERFLPNHKDLRADSEDPSQLLIDQSGISLAVSQLSDGERGVLALVLDLARRLSQGNPSLADPLREGHAIVLIDELELHLHPKWQRQIVKRLETTFPNCQFIATTHSPQVIGEVARDQIQIMAEGEVYRPPHAFGMDSSRVLEEIMDAPPRNEDVEELLGRVSTEIGRQRYDTARKLVAELVDRVGENDPVVTRFRTLLDFMEGDD